jgi:uncharacterized YigZ family protein
MQKMKSSSETKLTFKGSKFIAYGTPISNSQETDIFQEKIKSEHLKATHHCPAYRQCKANLNSNTSDSQVEINISEYSNDDGEPSGTAGLPILNALRSFELVQSAIVVVRYFGGTKLGTSGLIDAYGSTARTLIEQSKTVPIHVLQQIQLSYPYALQNEIDQLKHRFPITEMDATYLEDVTLELGVKLEQRSDFITYLDKKKHLGWSYQIKEPILESLS